MSKPLLAQAGARLLGVDPIGSGPETAARSVHRQTAASIVATEEADIVINALPVLVVVAGEIAGAVGARAAVGLNLPESATSINLGSNQGVAWKIVRSLSCVAAGAVLAWLLAVIAFYVSAGSGSRVAATGRLGRGRYRAENNADESGWYQLAFDGNVSETGFRYSVLEEFDCAESRGGNSGAFFLINHWVETRLPVPSEADRVNATEVLRERVAKCDTDRGRRPGITAVNFWERGDLLSFVDELNDVGGA